MSFALILLVLVPDLPKCRVQWPSGNYIGVESMLTELFSKNVNVVNMAEIGLEG